VKLIKHYISAWSRKKYIVAHTETRWTAELGWAERSGSRKMNLHAKLYKKYFQ